MTALQSTIQHMLVPSAVDTQRDSHYLAGVLAEVAEVIAPVWPLKDYVAVNPYAGISHRSFMDARAFLRVFSDCETLMPIEYYAAEYHQGRFEFSDIEAAIEELAASGLTQGLTAVQISQNLAAMRSAKSQSETAPKQDRPIQTIAEKVTKCMARGFDWTEAIVEEISKHCAAHYDEGQATWSSPYAELSLYQAWQASAQHDCNIEVLGLPGFRKYVAGLPSTPEASIAFSLQELRVPQPLWSTFLLCQAFSMPGWTAWVKYQSNWAKNSGLAKSDLAGLLAIRMAYDAALAKAKSLTVNWSSYVGIESTSIKVPRSDLLGDTIIRFILLRATEIAYRNSLLHSLSLSDARSSTQPKARKLAQMVFCIDVRSERIRRQLESQSSDIETYGFAGFFGMAFEYVEFGQQSGNSQLPVLLKPQFKVYECIDENDTGRVTTALAKRQRVRSLRRLWKSFQASAVGCFSVVETTGLFFGASLLRRMFGFNRKSNDERFDGLPNHLHTQLGPTLKGLNQQGVTTSRQADMAEGMLRNLGITKDFANLVVFCGHASQTANNPLAAGLDCGACGGHSGEPNARFAARLLNQPYIRKAMADRGIVIPDGTHFLSALHNTTTDQIEFFDIDNLPEGHRNSLQELNNACAIASKQTRIERLPIVASKSRSELLKRASDWSEVRPEWGLAGNASFIVARRSLTKHANLDARAFLHSYDYTQDTEGKVLETIMTAPMIVANWINMQYYASTVDNHHFGSGTKTVHNVVGGFGIFSGNGGDLKTGLPLQSLHTGKQFQHLPMRLQVVIDAPREMIDRVIAQHQMVSDLLTGGWLHLVAIEEQKVYRFVQDATWEPIDRALQGASS